MSHCSIWFVSLETAGIYCRKLVRAEKFKMASKMAAIFRRSGLSLGSLQWVFKNRVTVKMICEYSLIYTRIFKESMWSVML